MTDDLRIEYNIYTKAANLYAHHLFFIVLIATTVWYNQTPTFILGLTSLLHFIDMFYRYVWLKKKKQQIDLY